MKSRLSCWSGLSALVMAGLFSSFAAQANLIVNGGFEDPVVAIINNYEHRNGNELLGWTLALGPRQEQGLVHFRSSYDLVSEGSQAVQLELPGDRISQSFATILGEEYLLSFDLSAFNGFSGIGTTDVTVGPASGTYTGTAGSYVQHTLSFTAASTLTTVSFENTGVINTFPHLDNVSVTGPAPVPLPAAFWLFGSGLIGVVGIAKRRVQSWHHD